MEKESVKYDYTRLNGIIVEKFGTRRNFAKEIGKMSETKLSLKLNNVYKFTQDEIVRAATLLEIPKDLVWDYFFTEV